MEGNGVIDFGKRRKLKSNTLNKTSGYYSYLNENLDQWLDTCLKDASQLEFSSSSEFLDHNPISNLLSVNCANKKKYQTNLPQQKCNSYFNAINSISHQSRSTQSNRHYLHEQQREDFTNMNNVLTNANGEPSNLNNTFVQNLPKGNVVESRIGSYSQNGAHGADFASLPPMISILGRRNNDDTEILSTGYENPSNDTLNACTNKPNITRRFSDSCLLRVSKKPINTYEQLNLLLSDTENINRIFTTLMEQIQLLLATNAKIYRNLHETKVDIEAFKHAHALRLRYRRDSISGLSTHSQPQMMFGNRINTQSPAPTCQSSTYTPGMMADVVREVKEATRIREDALLNRVQAMVAERQWSFNELQLHLMHDLQELKSHVHRLRMDRKVTNKRITNLEAENQYMRKLLTSIRMNASINDMIYENEMTDSKKTFISGHRTPIANLTYGNTYQQSFPSPLQELQEEQRYVTAIPFHSATTNISTSISTPNFTKKDFDAVGELHCRKKNSICKVGLAENDCVIANTIRKKSLEFKKELQSAYSANQESNEPIISWV